MYVCWKVAVEEKLDGKSDLDVRRAVVAKLAPHVGDVSKMDAAAVEVLYQAETKRADAAGGQALSPSDQLIQGLRPVPAAPARPATLQQKIDAANKVKYHSHEKPAAK